ncbi:MAG TPA: lipopolysaccharide biosynthesis protein [Solirubrobacteraceae bacterium]|jgi:O-antigen/teichoic acid export membrane protein
MTPARGLRNASVYALTAGLRGALAFLLLPLYTHVLSPAEYGRLAIILSITAAATIAFSLGLDYALLRNFFQLASDPAGQRRLIDSLWTFLIVASLAAALALSALVAPWLSAGGLIRPAELIVGLIAAALYVSATTVPLSLMRAQERLRDYVVLSIVYAAATAAATVMLVVVLDAGVGGWLLAMLLANLAAFVAACRVIPWRPPKPFDRRLVHAAVLLGVPLIPHFLGHWALTLADRAVLGGIVSTTAVGVYTLAATLALPALILVQSLGQAFAPSYAGSATNEPQRAGLPGLVSVQAASVLAICLSVALLGPSLVRIVAPPAYHGASPLVPWIALGYAFLGLYSIPMSGLSLGMGHTKSIWIATVGAALTNIGAIYLLVPRHGIIAAAIASAIGYLVLLVAVGWLSRSPLNPVRYEWSRLLRVLAVIAAVYTAAVLTTDDTGIVDALVRVAWLAVAAVGLVVAGGVSAGRLRVLMTRLRPA